MSDLGPEARSILDEGRDGDDPSPADRARVRKNLSRLIAAAGAATAATAGGGAASAGAASTATAGSALSAAVAGKILGGVLLLGALGGGAWVLTAPAAPQASPAAQGQATSVASVVAAPAPEPPAEAPAPASAAPSEAPAPSAAARPVTSVKVAAAPTASADADTLEEETRRLREAHSSLQAGDADKALQLLDEQSAAYADGQLREERAAARVLALCKLGKVDEARAAAAAFLRDNPRSPLSDRVRGGCPAAAPAP